jgi:hypothetical protein
MIMGSNVSVFDPEPTDEGGEDCSTAEEQTRRRLWDRVEYRSCHPSEKERR